MFHFSILLLFLFSFFQKAVPFVSKKKNVNEWLHYRSDWHSTDIREYLFAHLNRKDHSIEELRGRAQLELETKQKNQRRKNRSSLRIGNNGDYTGTAVVDPEDCLTYAMYPIEPEVLVNVLVLVFVCLCVLSACRWVD